MIKRKTNYIWGLLLLFLVIINSCRNDFLQENSMRQRNQISGMTSKIINLNQSKHRGRIVSQIEKAKTEFNKPGFKNAFGKKISYGDSVTIDTDHVIYIENANYHTYTFKIQRSSPSPNDPVENLLLAPLPDGTYKEFLVTYNLTAQEKENILSGHYFYNGNNTAITELASGIYNGSGQLAKMSCGWETRIGWNKCTSQAHDGSNFMECEFLDDFKDSAGNSGVPPTTYTYSVYVCKEDANKQLLRHQIHLATVVRVTTQLQ